MSFVTHPLGATRWFVALVVAAFGCSEDASAPAAVPGTPCASFDSYCDRWDSLTQCMDGRWTAVDCVEMCDGATAGCLVKGSSDHPRASCVCDGPVAESTTADTEGDVHGACADDEVLIVCDHGECTEHACTDVCAETPDYQTSLGCRDGACACTAIGTACTLEDDPARCAGGAFMIGCFAERWLAIDCRVLCEEFTAECTYSDAGFARCSCLD